jgi:predicted RNase H-like HicB family nuclease
MQYSVILEKVNGHYRATIPALIDLMAEGKTRDEALQNVYRTAETRLAKIEIATIEMSVPQALRPDSPQAWLLAAGKFKGEEEAMKEHIDEIYAERKRQREEVERELDLEANTPSVK